MQPYPESIAMALVILRMHGSMHHLPLPFHPQHGNLHVIRLLLVFGAGVNSLDSGLLTPLDVAVDTKNRKAIVLLQQLGGVEGELAKMFHFTARIPRLNTFHDPATIKRQVAKVRARSQICLARNGSHESAANASTAACESSGESGDSENMEVGVVSRGGELERTFSNQSLSLVTLKDMEDGNTLSTLYERLQQCINMTLELSGGHSKLGNVC